MQGNDFSTVPRYFYVVVTQKPKSVAVLSVRHYSNYGKLHTYHQIQLAPSGHTQSVAGGLREALFDSGISLEISHDDEFRRHHSNPMPVLSWPKRTGSLSIATTAPTSLTRRRSADGSAT